MLLLIVPSSQGFGRIEGDGGCDRALRIKAARIRASSHVTIVLSL